MPLPKPINRSTATPDARPSVPPAEDLGPVQSDTADSLSEDEIGFLLRTTLLPKHHDDPLVLRYIMAYLDCRDSAQASKEAGIHTSTGRALRQKPDIHACITAITEKALMKYGYDASEVIERLKEFAGLDPIEFENPDGSYKTHMSQIKPEARRAIKSFTVKNLYSKDPNGMNMVSGQIIKVELFDKIKVAELLGREKNILKETKKVEHDVTANMASVLLDSSRRADARALAAARPQTPTVREVLEIQGRTDETDTGTT